MKVAKHLVGWIGKGVKRYYITGNHDEMLCKFEHTTYLAASTKVLV